MKFFALLSVAVVVCVEAVPVLNTGSSHVQRSDDGHGNYAFAYKEQHASGGTSRQEKGGPGYQAGSYTLNDHDGRQRVVNYVADAHGFRANIKTNEPGVDGKEDPADVSINGGGYIAGPAYGYAGPVLAAGPVGYAAPEAYGYGGPSYGGPLGSYSASIHHTSYPAKVIAAPLVYGKGYY